MGMYDEYGLVADKVVGIGFRRSLFGRIPYCADRGGVSMTKQEFKDECDINKLMARYRHSSLIPHVNRYRGSYEDVTGAVSFQEAQEVLARANDAFMSLPSDIRARFDNDPGLFLEFATDARNVDELVKLGLAVKKEGVSDGNREVREEVSIAKGSVEKSNVSDGGKSA